VEVIKTGLLIPIPNLLSFIGSAGAGKDECSKAIKEILPGGEWRNLKWSSKLKEIASLLTGIPRENWESQEFKAANLGPEWNLEGMDKFLEAKAIPMTGRMFLQRLGEGLRANLHKNLWINSMKSELDKPGNYCITDTRYRNEVSLIKERGGIIIRVINPRVENKDTHISERELDMLRADYEIINDGTIEDLRQKVLEVLKKMKLC